MANDQSTTLDFSVLFEQGHDYLTIERVQEFLDRSINLTAKRLNTSPNHLVRVVQGRTVVWMTQEQASQILNQPEDQEATLKDNVEQALRGDVEILRQEMEILMALVYFTYNQIIQENENNHQSLKQIHSSLERRKQAISEDVTEATKAEKTLAEKRSHHPFLKEYENMVGAFLQVKAKGNFDKAKELAKQLQEKKTRYLLLTRALEPDLRTIYYHRLNLQKTKKHILNTQNQLLASRMKDLIVEIKEVKKHLLAIQKELKEAHQQKKEPATLSMDQLNHSPQPTPNTPNSNPSLAANIQESKDLYKDKSTELKTCNFESKIVNQQMKEVEQVIQHVSLNVLGENEYQVVSQSKKIDVKKPSSKPSKPKHERMHTTRDRS